MHHRSAPSSSSSAPVAWPRRLELPGFDLTCTHSDAWGFSSAPPSMLVIGAGATGVQVASIFNAFGSHVTIFEAAPRILMSEDHDVAAAVRAALQASGIRVLEQAGTIERFESCPAGVRLIYTKAGTQEHVEATVAVVAAGWVANTAGLDLAAAGVETDQRGYVRVDSQLRTTAPHIFAAGDITGHLMVVHEAVREGYLAATNAVLGRTTALPAEVSPIGSFTDPEYASVGVTEATARSSRDVIVATERFDALARPIIDGRPTGFCKLVVDRAAPHHPRLPHRGRARRRAGPTGRGRHGRRDDSRAARPGPVLIPHLRQRHRARRAQSRPQPRTGHQADRR